MIDYDLILTESASIAANSPNFADLSNYRQLWPMGKIGNYDRKWPDLGQIGRKWLDFNKIGHYDRL